MSSALADVEHQFNMSRRFSDRLALEDGNNRRNRLQNQSNADRRNDHVLSRRGKGASGSETNLYDLEDRHDSMLTPFSGFNMFTGMDQMMRNMHQNMEDMMQRAQKDPNCHVYQSSNFYSYDSRGDQNGRPKVYQAHRSLRQAGDLKEERKGVRDSRTAEERVHVGRYIKDSGEVVERRHNYNTGDREENRELVGLQRDEDAVRFQESWRERTKQLQGSFPIDRSLGRVDKSSRAIKEDGSRQGKPSSKALGYKDRGARSSNK